MLQRCDDCIHADYRAAARANMKGFLVCPYRETGRYGSRISVCDTRKFQQADDEVIAKRVAWLAKLAHEHKQAT